MQVGQQLGIDHGPYGRRSPIGLRKQVMGGRKSANATVQPVGKFLDIVGAAASQCNDRQHVGERVLHPVIEFAGQGISNRSLFLEPVERSLVFLGLLRKHSHEQHQQRRHQKSENQCRHRQAGETTDLTFADFEKPRIVRDRHRLSSDTDIVEIGVMGICQQVFARLFPIVQTHCIGSSILELERALQEIARIEGAIDETLQLTPALSDLEHRHVNQKPRCLAVAFLL